MEKERGEEAPKFAFVDDCEKIESAESMQRNWIGQRSSPEFDAKDREVEQNENAYNRRMAQSSRSSAKAQPVTD